ncbi:MAG: hypothetical protein BVN29_11370 [Nitrospira sp. ST-bin5]|nr:MAG: hypothetical protein BVN29_11370 [Nitrospira sp. ST-bin5]
MLRMTVKDEVDGSRLVIEGRLTEVWADEARHYWNSLVATRRVVAVVDVQGVIAVDAVGKALMQDIHRRGVRLVTKGCLMNSVVADITGDCQRSNKGARRRTT